MTNEDNRGPARENEPSKQPESVTVFPLGKVDADAFEKALNNPPEPNDELRKLMAPSDMVERDICGDCMGSGEGVASTICGTCDGSGGVAVTTADRVANAVLASLHGYAGITISLGAARHAVIAALEASHHAELVEALRRWDRFSDHASLPPQCTEPTKAILAKIGGDA